MVFCKNEKAVVKNLAIFTEKHFCRSPFFNKTIDLYGYNFIKKRLKHWCFPLNIEKFLGTAILKNICERLLLHLTDFSEQLVCRQAIFQNVLFLTYYFYFAFVSFNTFISLSNFIAYRDSQAKENVHVDKESNSRKFRVVLMYIFSYTQKLSPKDLL